MNRIIYVVVGSIDSAGEKTLVPVRVRCTDDDIQAGRHYAAAKVYVEESGMKATDYVVDECDSTSVARLHVWENVAVVNLAGMVIDEAVVLTDVDHYDKGSAAWALRRSDKIALDREDNEEYTVTYADQWLAEAREDETLLGFRDWLYDRMRQGTLE